MSFAGLRALLDNPPRDFGPTPLWWWSGAKVTSERMRWQLERLAEGGVYNVVVINLAPAGPIVGARADDPAWFSEEWWARFTEACQLAQELGMRIWFYDQIGFSGANIQGSITRSHPEAAGRGLRCRQVEVARGRIELSVTDQLVAVYTLDGTRAPVDSAGFLDLPDGTSVRVVWTVPTAYDYLNPAAVARLMDLIHREFERRLPQLLGNVIAGSFQDELPATNSWTPAFADEFQRRRGYDLLDHLPALWSDLGVDGGSGRGAGGRAAKVRGDYYAVRAELTEEALFRPLGQWHSERGMLLGCDQFNPARAGYPTQATQLYTDYFRTHRWYSAAGSDHQGDAKVHSSMAHLYDHDRVWIESFHSSGWGGTLEDTYDWLLPFLRSGANLYNPHATNFGTAGGWFEWAPPSTDWRQPYWQQYPAFSAAVSRIASMLTWGTYSADVALLYPAATAQALVPLDVPVDHFGDGQLGGAYGDVDQTQSHYLALAGTNDWFSSRPGLLDAAGVSFDVIDDASIQRAAVTDGAVHVGDLGYATVIVASASVLEEATARQLSAFADSGGRLVIVGRPPVTAAGLAGDDAVVRALTKHPAAVRVATPAEAIEAIPDSGYARAEHALLVRRRGDEAVALVTAAFPNASAYPLRTGEDWLWEDYDFDPGRYRASIDVTVRASVAEAELWDPVTGATTPAPVTVSGETSVITADLAGSPAALLVWREGEAPTATAPAPSPETRSDDVSTGWTGELVPTLDNTWGDLALPAGASVADLQLWTFDWSEASEGKEPSVWQPVKVTNGQRVLVLDAVGESKAPDRLDEAQVTAVREGGAPLTGAAAGLDWSSAHYSTSRGREKDRGHLGNKGMVPEEFVQVAAPVKGEVSVIRTVVDLDRMGPADLVVGAGAARRVWWNGVEQATGDGYLTTSRIDVAEPVNVLEIHLGPYDNHPDQSFERGRPRLGCFFTVVRPDGFGVRPQFMTAGESITPDGHVNYAANIRVSGRPVSASLVAGAATGLSILLDGVLVARQEKVEYYESSWGATPMFFSHDVTAQLGAGEHRVEVVADSTDPRDVVLLDVVVKTEDGVAVLVSGNGWATTSGGISSVSREHRGHWSELASVHAAERSHPLPGTTWLHGEPVVGVGVDPLRTGDTLVPAVQSYRAMLPAGTMRLQLPLSGPARVAVDGQPHTLTGDQVVLDAPLTRPAELSVTTDPVVFDRGGAFWTGPAVITTVQAPIDLGNWQRIGLRSWSGGVRYRRTIDVPVDAAGAVLDLGRVRGSVDVTVAGVAVSAIFCAPYRVDLGNARGGVDVEVSVYNTLAPFFDESTPTMWVFPSQLESGLFGPVTLTVQLPTQTDADLNASATKETS